MAAVFAPRPLLGAVLLLSVSVAWGSAFPLMKDLIVRMPVADLLAERYGIATFALFALRPGCLRRLPESTWLTGLLLGLLFGVGQTAQAVALHDLPSSVSGFTVGSSVVITPVLGLVLLGARISGRTWGAVALALAAMTVFTLLREAEGGAVSLPALAVTLLSAVLYAGHTLVLGNFAGARRDAYAITVIQLGTIALMTGVLAVPDGLTLPRTAGDWALLGHLSIVACALGFLARSYGQLHVPPVPAAVILSAQPLWVTALAVVMYGEPLTWAVFLGGGLIALAMLLVVLPGGLLRTARRGTGPAPPR
ncbi:EamA-like transporter family protein [Streptosporangium canum]|uniref:EamA-like transporter family protein n=1 Tax=Streptosporangium canum TaxID=324952 RepID=A0A1I3ZMX5_9ACTN|nr:EamA-like transporter family protein [Streptosporangium canum]